MCIGSGSRFDRVAPTDKRVDFECVIKIAGQSYDLSSWLVHILQCPVIFFIWQKRPQSKSCLDSLIHAKGKCASRRS